MADLTEDRRPVGSAWHRIEPEVLRGWLPLIVAGAALIGAEAFTVTGRLGTAVIGHGLALALLIVIAAVGPPPLRRLSIALVPVPVLRVCSIAVPALLIPSLTWYVEIAIPVIASIALAARALALRPRDLGLRRMPILDTLVLTVFGAGLGLPAYLIALPEPIVGGPSPVGLIGTSVTLILTVAFVEELLLRGLIQTVSEEAFARGGTLISTGVTALLYAASLNLRYVVFMTLVAVVLSAAVRRSGSLAGAIGAHGALVCVQLVACPLLLR